MRAALPPDTVEDIYRVLLTGERGAEALDLEGLTRALAPGFYGLTLRDRTRVQRAVWDRMEEDTLTGLFLRLMAARCRKEPENEILQQAVRFGLAALENGERMWPHEDQTDDSHLRRADRAAAGARPRPQPDPGPQREREIHLGGLFEGHALWDRHPGPGQEGTPGG